MRLYSFVNYYISPLQQGLQTAHIVSELFNDYTLCEPYEILTDWAKDHKTIVILKGGNSKDLLDLYDFFNDGENDYPFAKFCEDEQSLNGACTAVGIILPEIIYETAALIRNKLLFQFDSASSVYGYSDNDTDEMIIKKQECAQFINHEAKDFQINLIHLLNRYSLA